MISNPDDCDVLVIWNRYGHFHEEAKRFERAGANVIIVENGWLGRSWLGEYWYAMARNHHAGAGTWNEGGPERWDSLNVDLAPWQAGSAAVILGQRGIGEPGIASPRGWAESVQRRIGGRIRAHPGNRAPIVPLVDDLKHAECVVTWASGAALTALLLGVPVWYEMPKWIGAPASRHISEWPGYNKRDDDARLDCFRRLAWAQWRLPEIESGAAFDYLLA